MANVFVPQCFIEIYPFEGGTLFISGAQLLVCTVNRNIRDDVGSFTIQLPPGGPAGVDSTPTWTEIVTPMSLALIGMTHGETRQVTMVGVVTTIAENQEWSPDGVVRTVRISGQDMARFLLQANWMNLTIMTATGAALADSVVGAGGGLPATLGANYLSGTPSAIARNWYDTFVAGKVGILAETIFPFKGGWINFSDAVASWFEEYPTAAIPYGELFFAAEGSWLDKFKKILPWPWYELFLTTAPSGDAAEFPNATGGYQFTMNNITFPSTPTLVGRVSPLPTIDANSSGPQKLDVSRWNNLAMYTPLGINFIRSDVAFNCDEVRNFFILNPTWGLTLNGDTNSQTNPFMYQYQSWYDRASVHRYGYNPEIAINSWMTDPLGSFGQKGGDFPSLVAALSAKVFSYYEPTPLMLSGIVDYPLRPDIFAGNRFRYNPFKDEPSWDFYILGVAHSYVFGGPSRTTLTLSRGLPTTVYDDTSLSGVLGQLHLGNAQRKDGVYSVGLPAGYTGQGLKPLRLADAGVDGFLAGISKSISLPGNQ